MAEDSEASSSSLPLKIRVYKRPFEHGVIGDVFDSHGFLASRPWTCSGVPEDSRKTCYETWEAAMEWATMSSEKRINKLNWESQFEMGQ